MVVVVVVVEEMVVDVGWMGMDPSSLFFFEGKRGGSFFFEGKRGGFFF